MLSSEVSIIPAPTPANDSRAFHESRYSGRHRLIIHSIRVLVAATVMVCHTMAHAPYPAKASHIPMTAPMHSPTALAMATGRTFNCLVYKLVWTIAAALSGSERNITRAKAVSWSPP